MRLIFLLVPTLASLSCTLAQAQTWWQCGGFSWTGPTTCYPGVNRVIINSYYKQCVPECAAPVSTTSGATIAPVPTTTAATTASSAPSITQTEPQLQAGGPPILALDGWAAGSYVQKASSSDAAILGPASGRGQFVTGESSSIRLISGRTGYCISFPHLNVKLAETSESYKPLVFEAVGTTLDWSFNGPDNILNTPSGSNTFVTCSDGALYLQTGSDLPSGNCTTTRLKKGPYY